MTAPAELNPTPGVFAAVLHARLGSPVAALFIGLGARGFGGGPLVPLAVEQVGGILLAVGCELFMIGPSQWAKLVGQ